jgi:LacI family transcriptional regulator
MCKWSSIFAGNDALALGVINYLLKEGIQVPDQVSILGYDNVAYAESALRKEAAKKAIMLSLV